MLKRGVGGCTGSLHPSLSLCIPSLGLGGCRMGGRRMGGCRRGFRGASLIASLLLCILILRVCGLLALLPLLMMAPASSANITESPYDTPRCSTIFLNM